MLIELKEVCNIDAVPSVRTVFLTRDSVALLVDESSRKLNEATSRLGPMSKIVTTNGRELYVLGTASQVKEKFNKTKKGLLNG